ncbi:hypothetical protein : Uncharacterized protein OS=Pirellula staleyi (strain ATCC 27377 / DSM 6068 / ICPB 4128) GN=Psta_0349 PE=4 SV=1: DUF1501 [Gemmataceae bacterium]|nr:hypothetical protein : Uncharacterized protein OS=Pirellula staleyi (strain ATCC 27377 / DSM 6068 / ICPB 4128) GN=Psta_0349 PE=4 SV=1: DUF1501 [Gemmataceae bacterium]VTU00461.1 hypothetical protein : Uncharacterized protein OS=Pirellula staleyi (strain ATCC 27377 / DSM 6068 / ICPB 4128) GN=Psta_0349 PE=4 SV=1: DUF1501 [Gemmataceae bacterium]
MNRNAHCPGPSRRDVLKFGSVAVAAAAAGPALAHRARGADHTSNDPAVIFVWLPGGPPHQDTFDMKPDAPAEYRGAFRPIQTNVPGIQICEHMPRLATVTDKYSIIRSIAHTFADHGGGHKRFLTGRDPLQPTGFVNDTPMVGSMAAEVLKHRKAAVPNYVNVCDGGRQGIDVFSFGSAYLGPQTHPFTVAGDPAEPKFEVRGLSPVQGAEAKMPDRIALLNQLDRPLSGPDLTNGARAIEPLRGRALDLVTKDSARTAFDLSKEPRKLRERYGMHRYGQRALMARRLVEHGSNWVTVVMENATPPGEKMKESHSYNWDSHAVNCHIFEDTQFKLGFLDQAISALIEDLYARGLNKRVLLVVTGEFGRTPKVEYSKGTQTKVTQPGRDHWPQAQSVLVSGACKTGLVVGSTTSKAEVPKDRPMTPNDLWATVFTHLGIDYNATAFPDGSGRPMPMLPFGDPIRELV